MPVSVYDLFKNAGITVEGKTKWGNKVNVLHKGIYVVAISKNEKDIDCLKEPVFNCSKIKEWIERAPSMTLDGKKPKVELLIQRLRDFWLPDETILYIGQTKRTLKERVAQYYRSKIGKRSPHSGGHWIKAINNLEELTVYWSTVDEDKKSRNVEDKLLNYFVSQVSEKSKEFLFDKNNPLPFANLEYPKGNYKGHGLDKQRS